MPGSKARICNPMPQNNRSGLSTSDLARLHRTEYCFCSPLAGDEHVFYVLRIEDHGKGTTKTGYTAKFGP